MQRFKNLTKKSGKVASAILSAAMVTSMVLGTNVVEVKAATNDAENTADVQAATNKEYEEVQAAKAEYANAVKDFTVTTATITNGGIEESAKAAYDKAAAKLNEKYKNVTVAITTGGYSAAVAPEVNKTGSVTVEYTVEGKTTHYKETGKVTYTLPSINDRAASVQKAIDEKLADPKFKVTNSVTEAAIAKQVAKLAEAKDDYGIALYSDYNFKGVTNTNVTNFVETKAEKDKAGSVSATVTVDYATTDVDKLKDAGKVATTSYSATRVSLSDLVTEATAEVKDYLQNDATTLDKDLAAKGSDEFKTVEKLVPKILANKGYNEYGSDITVTGEAVDITSNPNSNHDGAANVTFTLTTGNTKKDADLETKDLSVVLLSDKSKADNAAAKLADVASKTEVDSTITGGSFIKHFIDALNDNAKSVSGSAYTNTSVTGTAVDTGVTNGTVVAPFDEVYPGVTVTFNFVAKDGANVTDGDPKVNFTVTAGSEIANSSVKYNLASNQTDAEAAKAAVEAALDKMTVTNATTKKDVANVVEQALKDGKFTKVSYKIDDFDKHDATADKEGTLNVSVKLYSDKNDTGFEVVATASKTFSYLSNTFVEKDGKKFYYDKDGNLLKNTFLQGTDSPDGYTYYIQNDGSVMQDRLTYHPNGKDVIYFDAEGHEVFDAFVNVKKDVQGNAVDYIGYFGTLGGAYVNQTTYGNGVGAYSKDALFYINDYGVLENKGWFQNAAGNIGYAATNGTLTTSQWSLDQFGRKVYFQANGFLAKGLMTDGVKTYQLDETDGHLVGEF